MYKAKESQLVDSTYSLQCPVNETILQACQEDIRILGMNFTLQHATNPIDGLFPGGPIVFSLLTLKHGYKDGRERSKRQKAY